MGRFLTGLLVVPGGLAAIAWQLVWQHHAALALGVSAQATALILATLMAGMMAGALLAGRWLERRPAVNPWIVYGALELFVGCWGQVFRWLQQPISQLDATVFQASEMLAPWFLIASLVIAVGPAAIAIGATTPVIGLLARQSQTRVSRLYSANTAGAALGAIVVAFWLIPAFGVAQSSWILTAVQVGVFGACSFCASKRSTVITSEPIHINSRPVSNPALFAIATGAATFLLELVWFRMIRSAWLSTVDSFAIILFAFLIALAVGAWLAPVFQRKKVSLPLVLAISGVLIIVATPLIQCFDLWRIAPQNHSVKLLGWLALSLVVMGPPVALLGTSLPWLMDSARDPRTWARLYAWNTLGATLGALGAAWIFIQWMGPGPLAWLTGVSMVALGVFYLSGIKRIIPAAAAGAALLIALAAAPNRLTGGSPLLRRPHEIVGIEHGPDVTTAIIDVAGGRALFIDGYAATGEFGAATSYMDAMGRVPMLLHEDPRAALVICFGTGQTAHALRSENPERLDAVDVNAAVFDLAEHFTLNRKVLADERVHSFHMDGRAFLRRGQIGYDVITLEPMPPLFAGTNALYSVEFYELVASRLNADGIAAQWFPMHLLSPENARSAAAAFIEVFPNSILWIDPSSFDHVGAPQQGILLGSTDDRKWDAWPGFDRKTEWLRPLTLEACQAAIALRRDELQAYIQGAEPVTDDNLLLTHGSDRQLHFSARDSTARQTMELIDRARGR